MYITIRTFDKSSNADYVKYRLELEQIDCKIVAVEPGRENSHKKYKIEVQQNNVEKAIGILLKIQKEYPDEDYRTIVNPSDLIRILIPVDFSKRSLEAVWYAIGIAGKFPVEIKIMYVWNDELEDSVAVRNSQMLEDFKRIERNEIKRDINNKVEDFSKQIYAMLKELDAVNVLFHFAIVEGRLIKQISRTVEQFQPQLIIVAHNANSEFRHRITQSMASEIIDMALCPVLYIPVKAAFKPLNKLHVMYATNFNENDMRSCHQLTHLFTPFNFQLHCVHIVLEDSDQVSKEKMDALLENMKNIPEMKGAVHSNIVTNPNLIKGLDSFLEENKIDIVAFTSPENSIWHRLFNPDNRKKMMNGSELPLLIFRYSD